MRTIGVVTSARSDYGIYLPILHAMRDDQQLEFSLFVTGMHLSDRFGLTVRMIEDDGFDVAERIEMLVCSDTPEGVAKSMGLSMIGFAQVYSRRAPDILLVLGDRFEMYSAALAALPFSIPIAHIHGGELTEGAIDDSLRHSLTKLSHLHFVATEDSARRLRQMGEEAWRIIVSGAPGLDNVNRTKLLSARELEISYNLRLDPSPLLVTFHPTTLEYEDTAWQIEELLAAVHRTSSPVVFTMPNADVSSSVIRSRINSFVEAHASAWAAESLGTTAYLSLMAYAKVMVGNSSSGVIEAASFGLPVVNVGTRQQGRLRNLNVIDVGYERDGILKGIHAAVSSEFRRSFEGMTNLYGDGNASGRITRKLKEVSVTAALLRKTFVDMEDLSRRE